MTEHAWPSPDEPSVIVFAPGTGPVHLPSLTSAERAELLLSLRAWVADLVTRLHVDGRVIPPCWERHTGMVEALQALRDLERDCYSNKAPPSAGVDWFRGYREMEARLIELASLTNCSTREHRDPPPGWPTLQWNSRPSIVPAAPTPSSSAGAPLRS